MKGKGERYSPKSPAPVGRSKAAAVIIYQSHPRGETATDQAAHQPGS